MLEAVVAHIKQRLEHIVTLHNEIVRVISSDKALELILFSSATAEIKKRAKSLQTTLALDKLEDSEQNQYKLKALTTRNSRTHSFRSARRSKALSQIVIKTPAQLTFSN